MPACPWTGRVVVVIEGRENGSYEWPTLAGRPRWVAKPQEKHGKILHSEKIENRNYWFQNPLRSCAHLGRSAKVCHPHPRHPSPDTRVSPSSHNALRVFMMNRFASDITLPRYSVVKERPRFLQSKKTRARNKNAKP